MSEDVTTTGMRSVLVVDDEAVLGKLFADLLKSRGFRVEAALNGDAAIASLARQAYDVVFLDVTLGGELSGLDVFEEIQRQGYGCRVIFMTGRPLDDALMQYVDQADGLLRKPISSLYQILKAVE